MTYKKGLFIFRREYRLKDNTALIEALKQCEIVIPAFIFTPEQIKNNKLKSDFAVQFMVECLEELDKELNDKGSKLRYFFDQQHKVVETLIKKEGIDAVFINRDYTPYAIKRDQQIEKVCNKERAKYFEFEDYLLNPVGSVMTGSGTIYQKFTPYFNSAKKVPVRPVVDNRKNNFLSSRAHQLKGEYRKDIHKFYEKQDGATKKGGRSYALNILSGIKKYDHYNKDRNILKLETTQLSAYIKFGCVSIREVYHRFKDVLGSNNDLIKQLYWRDFYYNLGWAFPHTVSEFGGNRNLKENYEKVKWITYKTATNSQKEEWTKWKEGKTGFPVVDAAMREIKETGFMHNRGRLIVAAFLVKLMRWHWEAGEIYFSKILRDYDVNVNNGNWQWSSGSGADSQPYFRIFNPWSQSSKFDPDATYIKKWCPELKDVKPKHLHEWNKYHSEYDVKYPKPMFDYKKRREEGLKMYKKAF